MRNWDIRYYTPVGCQDNKLRFITWYVYGSSAQSFMIGDRVYYKGTYYEIIERCHELVNQQLHLIAKEVKENPFAIR